MLKPAEMEKVRVIALRKDMEGVVGLLHELGAVQFRKYEDVRLSEERPAEEYTPVTEQLVKVESLLSVLKPRPVAGNAKMLTVEDALSDSSRLVSEAEPRLVEIKERLDAIEVDLKDLGEASAIFDGLKEFDIDLSVAQSKGLCFFVGRIPNNKLNELNNAISSATDKFVLKTRKTSGIESIVAIVADRSYREYIGSALQKLAFAEARLPQMTGKPAAVSSTVKEKIARLKEEKKSLESELSVLSDKYYARAAILLEMLRIHSDRLYARSNFSGTGSTFVLEGWVPAADYPALEKALQDKFKGDVIIERRPGGEGQPTLLSNPKALGPFEFMIEFISLPKGSEIDPTLIFTLIFPIFYGMMLGDAGYGFISFFVAILLARKFKGSMLEPIGKIWAIVAFPTMFFGIIYNEYFGFKLGHIIGEHACEGIPRIMGFSLCEGFPRMENINTLLIITLYLGMAHLALGFLLGAYNKWREGHMWHAAGKLAWILVEFSGVALVASVMFSALPASVIYPAAGAFILGLLVILKAEGAMGMIEIPGLASNIFSYARILAVGIASVVVAELINELVLPTADMGIVAIALIPVYLGLHLFNAVLGMFESLVQGARLNYVEFFPKFYEGGGSKFNPFKYVKRFTR